MGVASGDAALRAVKVAQKKRDFGKKDCAI
jgi:hypothetical protein